MSILTRIEEDEEEEEELGSGGGRGTGITFPTSSLLPANLSTAQTSSSDAMRGKSALGI